MKVDHYRRRNAVASVAVNHDDLFDYDTDSDKVSDILEDDLERGSAVLAAFVVTLITVTFFGTLVAMLSVTMSLSGDYQVHHVSFSLLSNAFYSIILLDRIFTGTSYSIWFVPNISRLGECSWKRNELV